MKFGEQDLIMCEACNSARAVDVHHQKLKSQGGKDEITNLIGLCRNCHNKAHASKEFNSILFDVLKSRHAHEKF